jgi:hypothetical protein
MATTNPSGLVYDPYNSQSVNDAYVRYLGRPASESEIRSWLSGSTSLDAIRAGVAGSPEAKNFLLNKYEVRTTPAQDYMDEWGNTYYTAPATTKYIEKATGKEVNARDYRINTGQGSTEDKLTSQILSQNTTNKWSGQGHGSAEANAQDMAKILAGIGITDIRQFGQIPVYQNLETLYKYGNYFGSLNGDGKTTSVLVPSQLNENGLAWENVPIEKTTQVYGLGEEYGFFPVDPAKVKIINGRPVWDTGQTTYGNKVTGQTVPSTYGERQTGNAWGGTFAGKGNTGYRVQFTPDGTPVFYTTYSSSNTLANLMQDFGPVGQIALAVATGGLSIPQQIAAQFAFQLASGKDLEDAVKGAAISWAVAQIPGMDAVKDSAAYLNGIDPSGVLARSFQAAAMSGAKAILTGEDVSKALLSGAFSGGVSGAVDVMTKSIDGFDNLSKAEQSAAKNAMTSIIAGKPLDQILINSAIAGANAQIKTEKDNKSAKDAGWTDYATQQAAKSLYGDKVTPDLYADKQNTTEAEAKQIARDILGREPTQFEYMQLIGLPENEAANSSDLKAIKYDESTFDSSELAEAYKAIYGKEPTAEWLASKEAIDMLGRSDAQGKSLLNEYHTKDKNWVTESEAQQFWKDAGNKGSMPQTFMDELLMTSEAGAKAMSETYRIRKEDLDATTFDGSKYKDQKEAQAAAIKDGYNNYIWGDKNYYLMSPDQAETLKKDIAEGKTSGPKPDAFFTSVPGMSLEQQLAAAGNPKEYAYQQGDTITVVGKRMEVPSYKDLEAWNAYKEEKKAAGGDNFQSFLTEQFSILEQAMKGAPKDSVANVMANAAMFGYGKMAQLVEAFTRTGEAMGVPQAQRATNIAKQVQSWSNKLVDQGIQNAEAAVMANVAAVTKESIAAERGIKPSDISTAELYAQKTAALFKQIPNNPLGVSLLLAGEAIQEIPLLAASAGVGSVFKSLISKSIGMSAAVGTNAALNGAESFGGNYGEVKEYLQKQGVPESQIEALAIKSGFEAMGASMLTSFIGDRAIIKSFMGDLAKDSFAKVVATNSTREWFLGNLEGSLQNMSAQIGKYGKIQNENEWLTAGIMEGFIQGGITSGVLSQDALSQVVAKGYDGASVTLNDIVTGAKTFDPKTLVGSAVLAGGITINNAFQYNQLASQGLNASPQQYTDIVNTFQSEGITPSAAEITSIANENPNANSTELAAAVSRYADPRYTTNEEAKSFFKEIFGVDPTPAQLTSFVGKSETAAKDLASEQFRISKESETAFRLEAAKQKDLAEAARLAKDGAGQAAAEAAALSATQEADRIKAWTTANPTWANATKNQDQLNTEKILAMISNPSSADLRYDLNKDGKITAADAALVSTGTPARTDIDATGQKTPETLNAEAVAAGFPDRATYTQYGGDVNAYNTAKTNAANLQTAKNAGFPDYVNYTQYNGDLNAFNTANTNAANLQKATAAGFPDYATYTQYSGNNDNYRADLNAKASGWADAAEKATANAAGYADATAYKTHLTDVANTAKATTAGFPDYGTYTQYNGDLAAYNAARLSAETTTAINNAIAGIRFPAGISATDVANQVKAAMAENPGLSAADVTKSITDYMAANPGLTAADVSTAITNATSNFVTNASLEAALAGMSADAKNRFETLTQGQKDIVASQVQMGTDINTAITNAATQTANQIAGVKTDISNLSSDVKTKFENLTQGQKDIVASQVQMGTDLSTAIDNVSKQSTEQIAAVKTDLTKNITDVQTQFNTRVDELVLQGKTYQEATQEALKELGTGITGLQTGMTGMQTSLTEIQKQQEEEAKAKKAAAERARGQGGLSAAMSLIAPAAAAAVSDDTPYRQIGLKTTGEAKFEGPLEQYLKMVKEGDYSPNPTQQETQQQNQQVAPVQDELSTPQQQPQQGSDYFNYGQQTDINDLLGGGQTPTLPFKAGGLATPLFAGGGTTRYGHYAGGGLNVVHHAGKPRLDFRTGNAVTGPGDGQSDDIPAMLADGEFVFPADVVAALGNGSTKAGSDKLYDMMHSIRAYHRSAKPQDLPPPAKKSPLDYLKKPARKARR